MHFKRNTHSLQKFSQNEAAFSLGTLCRATAHPLWEHGATSKLNSRLCRRKNPGSFGMFHSRNTTRGVEGIIFQATNLPTYIFRAYAIERKLRKKSKTAWPKNEQPKTWFMMKIWRWHGSGLVLHQMCTALRSRRAPRWLMICQWRAPLESWRREAAKRTNVFHHTFYKKGSGRGVRPYKFKRLFS